MQSHTRASAASAHVIITGKNAAGLFDHAAARHLRSQPKAEPHHGYDGD